MKLQPLNNQVLVKQNKADEKTAGGIFVPNTANEGDVVTGEVLAAGTAMLDDGVWRTVEVKPGDKVFFSKRAAIEVKVDGESLLLLSGLSLLAKMSKEE